MGKGGTRGGGRHQSIKGITQTDGKSSPAWGPLDTPRPTLWRPRPPYARPTPRPAPEGVRQSVDCLRVDARNSNHDLQHHVTQAEPGEQCR